MKKTITSVFSLLLIFANLQLNAQEVIQLTDNNYPDWHPRISGNNVVWIGGNAADYESQVFYYDLNAPDSPIALTDSEIAKYDLEISGHKLVWTGATDVDDNDTREIYFYDLNGQGPTVQLTDNDDIDYGPAISGDNVVWSWRKEFASSWTGRIHHYDLSMLGQGEPIILADDGKNYLRPTISGNHLAWYYADGSDSEVIYYNLDTQEPALQLTSTTVFVNDIQLSDNKLWWRGWHGDIHYYNPNTQDNPVLIYDVTPNGYPLYLNVNNDFAVWSEYDGVESRDIFYYDLNGQNTRIQLTNDEVWNTKPIVSGGYIIWEGGEENETEIYYYDLINQGPITQLTDNDFKDGNLQTSGNKLVWQGGYVENGFVEIDSTFEVFTATLPELLTADRELSIQPYQLGTVVPNPVSSVGLIEYTLSESTHVSLQILDTNGRPLKVLTDAAMPAGIHQVSFNTDDLPSGVYLYSLQADNSSITKRMVVIR